MSYIPSLRFVAFGLVAVTGIIHFFLGVEGVIQWLIAGTSVLLPLAFLLATALVIGLFVAFGSDRFSNTAVYVAGAFLMIIHLMAYVEVHAVGVVEALVGADVHDYSHHDHEHDDHSHDHNNDHDHDHDHGHNDHDHNDHSHDEPIHEVVIDHLMADFVALTTKTSETIAMIAFLVLAVVDR